MWWEGGVGNRRFNGGKRGLKREGGKSGDLLPRYREVCFRISFQDVTRKHMEGERHGWGSGGEEGMVVR